MKPKVIRLSDDTFNRLTALAHPGQSLDGVIQEIFKELDKQTPIPPSIKPLDTPTEKDNTNDKTT